VIFINSSSAGYFASCREHLARDAHKLLDNKKNNSISNNQSLNQDRGSDQKDESRPLEKRICRAVTAGYFMNSAVLCAHGNVFKYMSLLDLERQRNRQEALDVRMVHIHPTSSLAIEGADCPHTTLVYQALAHGNKLYMKQVCRADSKGLKQLQREWVYVDPYVLCGRRQEAPAVGNQDSGSRGNHSNSGPAAAPASASEAKATSGPNSAAARPNMGASVSADRAQVAGPAVGTKRPLQADETASAPAPPGPNAAAEAAKQRYLERMAQQKARK
jgi:hypothetical protein